MFVFCLKKKFSRQILQKKYYYLKYGKKYVILWLQFSTRNFEKIWRKLQIFRVNKIIWKKLTGSEVNTDIKVMV